ncbi:YciI family protein [Allorhizocola rhizosphaerae]|uniref:YciI family protein n=1 Tax=Allorhizocola rhizosphaerae TaxID=1872709 RepID=UPI001FEAA9DB|nr:YciI family protein [Allorhizocola rhizosphaerae]
MILIHLNPALRAIWEGFTDAERAEGYRIHAEFTKRLQASGEYIASAALADPAQGVRIDATDGPFAEAKEYLAGFYLVECDSRDRAVELAAQLPEAALGMVEVRPVAELAE